MFTEKSFEVFNVEGLDERMIKIRSEIQPIFQEIGEKMRLRCAENCPETEFFLHIAQHRRRTANAPENTWSAISTKPRGYKMEAHFQLGIWADYVFVYLSIIDQPKAQKVYADKLLSNISQLTELSENFKLSKDHTKPEYYALTDLSVALERLQTVKKSEFEIGRIWSREKFNGQQNEKILAEMLETVEELTPIYKKLLEIEG
jgi:uncharacterized protein YktB (UPF0637 family)